MALAENFGVSGVEFHTDILNKNAIVIVRTQVGGTAFGRLQPPYESSTSVSQGEPCHDRILQRGFHSTDIDLSNL